MGQLEKYGLYVLCLLIFLILGVTLWGSGTVSAHIKNASKPPDLKAGGDGTTTGTAIPFANKKGAIGEPATKLPDFRELLKPAEPRVKSPTKEQPKVGSPTVDSPMPASTKPKAPPALVKRPTYTIRRGDNYESIARERFGWRVLQAEIARLNPKLDPRRLRPGKQILMPTQAEVDAILAKRIGKQAGVQVGGKYKIRKGDTLIGIAKRRLGTEKRVSEIKALNPGLDPINLKIGDDIRLPKK